MSGEPRKIELLAPAKNAEIAIAAIRHGADAVYIGADQFGARASAGNPIADIARVVEFAHQFDARIYATVNTILFDSELKKAEKMIRDLYIAGVDALIVQDMGILRLDIPPIALHASTQCDIRTLEKAQFLEKAGFSRLVLARELTCEEIRNIAKNTQAEIECFVHGALCVCYSGQCYASCAFRKRSANRGECAQLCRLPYNLTDSSGRVLHANKHFLSLRDFNMSDRIAQLADAGVSSFKIEGRLKDTAYVKNVTAHYHRLINDLCSRHPDKYIRASRGLTTINFTPDINKSFNRRFTHYFFDNDNPAENLASFDTPKSIGERFGKISGIRNQTIFVDSDKSAANGDGFVFFNKNNNLEGFRANKTDHNAIIPFEKIDISKGTWLYRNFDKTFTDRLQSNNSADRKLPIDIECWPTATGFAVKVTGDDGVYAIINMTSANNPKANTSQEETQKRILGKLGDTPFYLRHFNAGHLAEIFIPASLLSQAKRRAINAFEHAKKSGYRFEQRKTEDKSFPYMADSITFTGNVSNKAARTFYTDHGVKAIEYAMECGEMDSSNAILMTTRYCLRRELNCCLKKEGKEKLPAQLFLESGDIRFSVEFDCKHCQMLLKKA